MQWAVASDDSCSSRALGEGKREKGKSCRSASWNATANAKASYRCLMSVPCLAHLLKAISSGWPEGHKDSLPSLSGLSRLFLSCRSPGYVFNTRNLCVEKTLVSNLWQWQDEWHHHFIHLQVICNEFSLGAHPYPTFTITSGYFSCQFFWSENVFLLW